MVVASAHFHREMELRGSPHILLGVQISDCLSVAVVVAPHGISTRVLHISCATGHPLESTSTARYKKAFH
jgi:hypothetical protein